MELNDLTDNYDGWEDYSEADASGLYRGPINIGDKYFEFGVSLRDGSDVSVRIEDGAVNLYRLGYNYNPDKIIHVDNDLLEQSINDLSQVKIWTFGNKGILGVTHRDNFYWRTIELQAEGEIPADESGVKYGEIFTIPHSLSQSGFFLENVKLAVFKSDDTDVEFSGAKFILENDTNGVVANQEIDVFSVLSGHAPDFFASNMTDGYEDELGDAFDPSINQERTFLGSGDDVFYGTSEDDYVVSGGGNDIIKTGGGGDKIYIQSPEGGAEEAEEGFVTFIVTVGQDASGNSAFFIDGQIRPTLKFESGTFYHFDQSDPSNYGHQIAFATNEDGYHAQSFSSMLGGMPYGNAGEPGSYTELFVTAEDPNIFYFSEAAPNYGGGSIRSEEGEQQEESYTVEVDTGSGDDRVVVEEDWSGTLFVKNGGGNSVLEIEGDTSNAIYKINESENGNIDLILDLGDRGLITVENYRELVTAGNDTYYEIGSSGFATIRTEKYEEGLATGFYDDMAFGSDKNDYIVGTRTTDNQSFDFEAGYWDADVLLARDGNDILEAFDGRNILVGGEGNDEFIISYDEQFTTVFGDIFNYSTQTSQNSSYADVVEIDWSYDASEIEQIGSGYRIYNEDLDATVDIYDVEVLKFANGDGTWDTRYLTDGAPIGPGDFDVPAGTEVNYGDGSSVRFVLSNGSASSPGIQAQAAAATAGSEPASWLKVYAEVTETHMVEESYFTGKYVRASDGKVRTTPKSGYKAQYKVREVEETVVSEKLIWEGDKTSVDAFTFSDGVVVNVINVADKDWNDQPIEMTLGTDGIDLIFGNDSDNLIDAGLGDDIIFGGDGDDVIIGGEGDDILLGGDGDDIIRGDTVTDQDAALEYFAELTNYDDSQLSIDNSGMGTGGDDVIMGGDGIDDIDSGDGTNFVTTGRMDLDGDGEANLDIVKDFMEDNNIDNKDIFDNDDWV